MTLEEATAARKVKASSTADGASLGTNKKQKTTTKKKMTTMNKKKKKNKTKRRRTREEEGGANNASALEPAKSLKPLIEMMASSRRGGCPVHGVQGA